MHILAAGLNHQTAPVEVRERFALQEQELPAALQALKRTKSVLECVLVSTCNRTEIYIVTDRQHVCRSTLRQFIETWFHTAAERYMDHFYMLEDEKAVKHLFEVACGLNSMVIGETQILGQIRDAFLLAQKLKATGTLFNKLFKQAITIAKRVHSETTISENAVSVSYAAVELGKRIFGTFQHKNVLIIGAGKMSELTGKHLYASGADRVIVANRTLQRAEELAAKLGGQAVTLDKLEQQIQEHNIDVVISSTGAEGYVLNRQKVEAVMRARGARPLFMIDIAVPRDVDPEVHKVPDVYLYDIDDLNGIVESNLEQRRREAAKVSAMIEEEIRAFQTWYKTLGVTPVIRALQEKTAAIHEETMASMLNKLPDLTEREIKIIRKLSKSMLNQLTHDPIMRIKEKAAARGGEEALQLFEELFDLQLPDEEAEERTTAAGTGSDAAAAAPLLSVKLREVLARS